MKSDTASNAGMVVAVRFSDVQISCAILLTSEKVKLRTFTDPFGTIDFCFIDSRVALTFVW